ncbi:formate dehydrogenase subunit alpha [Candidatus Bathyarchaeota archaeon RBG_16_57_9]|nr:MAG: formate dehydrogenase subunit alpha [Candidatus Bathyarchaeota archaeon RBG_16_57_9]
MIVNTTCIYCGVGCHLGLHVRGGKVVSVTPGRKGPGEGKLCIKGWSAHEFIHHPDRLTTPLIREGGGFREASWEEALDLVAFRLREIKGKHGPDSLGFFGSAKATNEENYLLQRLARAAVGTNNVDHCARLCHASTVTGLAAAFGSGAMTNSQEDVEEADAILVIGSNTTEQHPLIARRIIRAVKKGARLVVADPREIQLCEYAEVYLQHKPGTDVALLNALMNAIIGEVLQDAGFIADRTEGFRELADTVERYTPEVVERITGVPAGSIREAARIYGSAGNAALFFSMGITQHTTGVDNVVSCANLAMLTGNLGRPGTGVNPLRGQNNVQGGCDVGALPNYLPGYQSPADVGARARFGAVWGVGPPETVGLTLTEMVDRAGKEVKALFVMGENPMLSDPDIGHVEDQLGRLEFLAVSEMFMSETAELADVVFPACSYAEKDGTFTSTDRRVQLVRKAVEPLGGSRPDWWIIQELSRRLGHEMSFSGPDEIMDEVARVAPIYGGISHARLQTEDLRWPCRDAGDPGIRILHVGRFSRGRGRFHAVEHRPPAEEPDDEYPLVLTTGRQLFHWHTGTMTRRSGTLVNQVNEAYVEVNPADAAVLGVGDMETVRVTSRRGSIELRARVTARIMPGIVFIPFHYVEAAANRLTINAVDPVAKIPEFKACAVRVERIQ